ncbi:MAG: sigma-70 family RNA polymerase sigma factor [Opitutaceae bacterium]|nr:sigma-70 family RNA polymerase sigma factor [Opitutaceae bacterium]
MEPQPAFRAPEDAVDTYDDVELFVRIADRERDEADADAAFTIFFERHAEFLRRCCVKYHYDHTALGDQDVVTRAMCAIYRGEAVFAPPARASSETVRAHLRKWLIQVARNQFYGEIRKLRFDQNVVPLEPDTDAPVTPEIYRDDEPLPSPEERTRILQFRDQLKPVDQIIFDRSIPYYDRVTGTFNVPPKVAQDIAAEVGKNVVAVRKRRERMMTALKTAMTAG